MSGSDLTVALKVTGDSTAAVAALEELRRSQLNAFRAGQQAADKAATQWKVAEAEVKRLAAAARDSGANQEQLAKQLGVAAAEAGKGKAAYEAATMALQKQRQAIAGNADALTRARSEAVAQASEQVRVNAAMAAAADQAHRKMLASLQEEIRARREAAKEAQEIAAAQAAEGVRRAAAAAAEASRLAQASRQPAAREILGVTAFRDLDREIARAQAAYNRLRDSGKLTAAELAQAQLKLIERTAELNAQKNGLIGTFQKVRAGAVALAAQFYVLGQAVRQAMQMETAMAEVAKVADFKAPAELERFKALLQDLTRELPYTAQELAAMAAAGAQMGIPTDQLAGFVTLAGRMGIAFRMSADDVGKAIAVVMNVFKLTQVQAEDLGDAINHLGNNTNAAERDILNVMTRIGGMANLFGLSARQSAALATAMLSLGRAPDVAATGINALLQKLATIDTAEEKMRDSFERTGLSVSKFSTLLKTDPQAAINAFLAALEKLPKSVKIDVLSGFVGREYADDIALLAGGVDKYREALRLAHDEAQRGGVGREAAKQAETTGAAFKRATEQVVAVGEALASPFLPLLSATANGLTSVASATRDFVQATGPLAGVVVTLGTLAAGAKTLQVATGALAWGAGTLAARLGMGAGLAGALTTAAGGMASAAPVLLRLAGGATALAAGYYAGGKAVEWFHQRFMGGAELDADVARLERSVKVHKDFNAQIERLNAAGLTEAAEKLRALKQAVLADQSADAGRTLADATQWADKIVGLHEEMAEKKRQLAQLTAQRDAILSGEAERAEARSIEGRIKSVQKLQQAKQRAMDEAIRDVERYAQAATAAYERAAGHRMSTLDRVRELRRRDMTEEQQQADIAAQAQEKLAAAAAKVAEARRLAGAGDVGGAEKAAQAAEALAKEAESLGASLKHTGQAVSIVEAAGKAAAEAATVAGDANRSAADEAQRSAANLKAELDQLDAKLKALETQKRVIDINADIVKAQAAIASIQGALAALQDKTVTVTVVTRNVEAHQSGGLVGAGARRLARGGALPGYGGGDRVQALLEAGEFVVRKEAVRRYGVQALMAVNAMRTPLPAYAVGGLVGQPVRAANESARREVVDINLRLPGAAAPVRVSAERGEAEALVLALNRLARVG